MDFNPINRIRLKEAYSDLNIFQEVADDEDYLDKLFEHTNRGIAFIHDNDTVGHSTFLYDTNGIGADKTFRINNEHHTDLFLWHIDGVLYKKDSKCDCAFLHDNYLGFVEFKSNALNNTEEAIRGNYDKASSQLALTIQDTVIRCRNIGCDILDCTEIEAYAVFNRTVPKNNAYQKSVAARFLLKTGIPLHFKNETDI